MRLYYNSSYTNRLGTRRDDGRWLVKVDVIHLPHQLTIVLRKYSLPNSTAVGLIHFGVGSSHCLGNGWNHVPQYKREARRSQL